jgi:hypothetical protein
MTLHEARQTIANLRKALAGPPKPQPGKPGAGSKPIPKTPEDPHPVFPGRTVPIPKQVDLAALAPAAFAAFLSNCDDPTLKVLLSQETGRVRKEYNASVVAKLYSEIKKRKL